MIENPRLDTPEEFENKTNILSSILGGITGMKVKNHETNKQLASSIDAKDFEEFTEKSSIGFVDFRVAAEEAKLLKSQLELAKDLAIKTKDLTEKALKSTGDLNSEGQKHQLSLMKHLDKSQTSAILTGNIIDGANDSVNSVLGQNLSYIERIKRKLPTNINKELYLVACSVGTGIGCGYIIGIILKKVTAKIKSK